MNQNVMNKILERNLYNMMDMDKEELKKMNELASILSKMTNNIPENKFQTNEEKFKLLVCQYSGRVVEFQNLDAKIKDKLELKKDNITDEELDYIRSYKALIEQVIEFQKDLLKKL